MICHWWSFKYWESLEQKCFQCFASCCWWHLQRLCVYEFSFLCICSWLNIRTAHCRTPSCRDAGCVELHGPATVRGESTHLLSHPLFLQMHAIASQGVTGWMALPVHRKGQRHGGKERSTTQHKKVFSEPNGMSGAACSLWRGPFWSPWQNLCCVVNPPVKY